jgi:hypothetical protein
VAQPLIYVKEALRLPRADDESANYLRRRNMGINKDQVQGRAEEAKGNVKEAVGKVVGDQKTLWKARRSRRSARRRMRSGA